MKSILIISGSLRQNSFNCQLARMAVEYLEGQAEVHFLSFEDLPYMNQDLEYPVPEAVARVRNEVLAADLIWIFTPEYNYSYPGLLKNLLDWLSRPANPTDRKSQSVLAEKKAAISGAAGASAAGKARAKLRELLELVGVEVLPEETGVVLGKEAFMTDVLTLTPEEEAALRTEAEAVLITLEK